MIRITKLQYSTTACLLAILCYGLLFFHDNALGGLVKPTIIIMAKSQKGGGQPPKKQTASPSDSTAYYKKEIKAYQDLIKSEPKTPMGRSNVNVYRQKISQANDALNRQSLKKK